MNKNNSFVGLNSGFGNKTCQFKSKYSNKVDNDLINSNELKKIENNFSSNDNDKRENTNLFGKSNNLSKSKYGNTNGANLDNQSK